MSDDRQWKRRVSLVLVSGTQALDLSEMHFRFRTVQADVETPNNCSIRVYNLSPDTVRQIRGEFSEVVLQAGYEGTFGVIFRGTIKWFGIGREDQTTTYLDILAADGDLGYNYGVVSKTLDPGTTQAQAAQVAIQAMPGLQAGTVAASTGGILPRGKVLFGMARDFIRTYANTHGYTWGIEQGRVNVVPLKRYTESEAVVLTSLTGLIGTPEQTPDGIKAKILLNPRLLPGGLVRIDNASINKLVQRDPKAAPVAYNSWTALQFLATTTADGLYRVFVTEHEGDTRGQAWYSEIVCLAADPTTGTVVTNG